MENDRSVDAILFAKIARIASGSHLQVDAIPDHDLRRLDAEALQTLHLGSGHANHFGAAIQQTDLVRAKIMARDFIVAFLAQMGAGRGDHRHALEFGRVQADIHEAVVRQRADVKQIGIDGAKRLGQSQNAERRRPVLGLPSPIGHHAQQTSSPPP